MSASFPLGLSFFSGLPKSVRAEWRLVPVQVWIDESGMIGQGPVFVMAGLMAGAEVWDAFSNEWAECLGQSPTIPRFKMHDAAHCRGGFSGFDFERRDRKLAALANVIAQYPLTLIHVSMDLEGYAVTIREHAKGPHRHPYGTAFLMMILACAYELIDHDYKHRFDLFFDEQLQIGPRIKEWYPVLRTLVEPSVQAILPPEPLFRSDDDFVPLQASDMFAWLLRRGLSGKAHQFDWLYAALSPRLSISEHVAR